MKNSAASRRNKGKHLHQKLATGWQNAKTMFHVCDIQMNAMASGVRSAGLGNYYQPESTPSTSNSTDSFRINSIVIHPNITGTSSNMNTRAMRSNETPIIILGSITKSIIVKRPLVAIGGTNF